jgi:hypothetical protein
MATTATTAGKDRFITPAEIRKSPRGRKAILNKALLETLGQVNAERPVVLGSMALTGSDDTKENRQKVGQVVRSHWKALIAAGKQPGNSKPRVAFSPDGEPQVEFAIKS